MAFYSKSNAPEPSLDWRTDGCMVAIYVDGSLIKKHVGLCWDFANTQGHEYEISDIRYGSIDGVILPEICDIIEAIQEKMGLHNSLILPDTMTHDPKL